MGLLTQLVAGLPPGTALPSERAMADHFGVARMTVRDAVDRLVAGGSAVRVPRGGTFTTQPRYVHTRHLASYDDDIRARGMEPGGHKVSARVRKASRKVAETLGIEVGARCLELVRLRTADDLPMAVTRSRLALDRFPGLERHAFDEVSLHDILADGWGVRPAAHSQRIRAVTMTAAEARLLQVEPGASAFEISGESRDVSGAMIETARSVYRADRYEIVLRTELP